MKRVSHFQPPRQSVIYSYTRRMLDETASNANTFAMALAQNYLDTVAPDVRNVPFRLGDGDDLLKAMKNNAQILRRFMDGTVKVLPADLEDAWVLALPEPYRSDCERDLALRRGLEAVHITEGTEQGEAVGLGRLMKEFGELVEALGPALADGRLDAADLPHAKRILGESHDVMAALLSIQRQLVALLPEGGTTRA